MRKRPTLPKTKETHLFRDKTSQGRPLLRERLNTLRKLLFIAYLGLVALSFQLSILIDSQVVGSRVYFSGYGHIMMIALIIWGIVLWNCKSCYSFRTESLLGIARSATQASLIASGIFIVVLFYAGFSVLSKLLIGSFMVISLLALNGMRLSVRTLLKFIRRRGYNYQTVLIVGQGTKAKQFADKIIQNSQWGYRIIGFIDVLKDDKPYLWSYNDIVAIGLIDDLPDIIKTRQVDWVVFAVENRELGKLDRSVAICEEMGTRAVVLTDLFPARIANKKIDEFFEFPVLYFDTTPQKSTALIVKGIFDRMVALGALVITIPILIFTAMAIKIFSKGPILFKQERLGINGRKFIMFKFRTMTPDADKLKDSLKDQNEMDGPVFKIANDPRVTPLGRWLRKTSIDELPQLFNVVKGDMSMVGPRPPLSSEVKQYDPWQRRRLSMKPGITCLWQIGGRNNTNFRKWMELDLKYIDNWSLWLDTKILARTLPAVISRKGAR